MENDLNAATGFTPEQIERDRRVLELLSQNFGSIQAASTEIINLEAILNLPKGTEHFVADLHGEDEAFRSRTRRAISSERSMRSTATPCATRNCRSSAR